MSEPPFISDLGSCVIHDAGWIKLPSGTLMTRMPVWDKARGLFARLGHGPAAAVLGGMGMRLPTVEEYDELHALALHIPPCTMPTIAQLEAAGVNVRSTQAIDRYRNANMRSLTWCIEHDAAVFALLAKAQWTDEPVANAGKHWATGGTIYGWWLDARRRIQNPSQAHASEPNYTDYATTFHAVRASSIPAGPRRTKSGEAGDEVRVWQQYLASVGYRPGPLDGRHGPKTEAASLAYERAGKPLLPSEPPSPPPQEPPRRVGRFLPAVRTPSEPKAVYGALRAAWVEWTGVVPTRPQLLVLLSQWAHETGLGRATWCHNLGNVKGKPNGERDWTFFACGEELEVQRFDRLANDSRVQLVRRYTRVDGVPMVSIKFVPDHPASCFRAFETLEAGAADYLELLRKRFDRAWPAVLAGDTTQFARLLRVQGYYTASELSYARALQAHYASLDEQIAT